MRIQLERTLCPVDLPGGKALVGALIGHLHVPLWLQCTRLSLVWESTN